MINQDFCEFLEYQICKAFEISENDQIKGFWCDGILLNQPETSYSQKFVTENKHALMKAFIGTDGQTEYELILKFGNKALSKIERNLDIKSCANPEKQNWFYIDTKQKTIEIRLD